MKREALASTFRLLISTWTPAPEGRGGAHHALGLVEHDARLVAGGRGRVDLGTLLAVGDQQVERDAGGQGALAVFPGHGAVGGAKAAQAIGALPAELKIAGQILPLRPEFSALGQEVTAGAGSMCYLGLPRRGSDQVAAVLPSTAMARRRKAGSRTASGRLSRAYQGAARDTGTVELVAKKLALVNGAADPTLSASAASILLAHDVINRDQHAAAHAYHGRVAKLVEIGTARVRNGMVVGFRRRGQGRWVSAPRSASRRPGAW